MALARRAGSACAVAVGLLAGSTTPAWAGGDHISVLSPDGRVHRHALPAPARATLPAPPPDGSATNAAAPPPGATAPHAAGIAARPTVTSELTRLARSGAITEAEAGQRRSAYSAAKRALRRLAGTRRRELGAVIATLDSIAARGRLTPSRLAPLWLTLARNQEWWTTAPWIPAAGERVGFQDDELVYQYYAGQGLQIQWLGTFGKLNYLGKSTSAARAAEASRMIDQILPLASARAGGIAWEYEFAFGGGAAPWTSSLSQGTGLQALARAAVQTGRQAEVFRATRKGLAVFRRQTPEGVRVKVPGGVHYAQYSFAPGLRILNGFVQSVVGLHDYAEFTGNTRAQRLFETGLSEAERELPEYDTGAWSLYSRGSSTHESDYSYHVLLRDFLANLCERTQAPVICDGAQRFTDDLTAAPVVRVRTRTLPAGRSGTLRLRLDKVSAVSVRVTRGDAVVLARYLGTIPYGTHAVAWSVPRRRGTYTVTVTARDLAGNAGGGTGAVRVVKRGG